MEQAKSDSDRLGDRIVQTDPRGVHVDNSNARGPAILDVIKLIPAKKTK